MTQTINISLPTTYCDDAQSRDLDIGDVFHYGKKQTVMTCTEAHLRELLSDSKYYASEYRYMETLARSIGRSAERAVPKIEAALQKMQSK